MRALVHACVLHALAAHAVAEEPRPLDAAQLARLTGIVQRQDLALVESKPDGTMRQVTLATFVRAPAAAVHDLVADVGGYLAFVPNLKQADIRRESPTRLIDTWRLELPISSFSGNDVYDLDEGRAGRPGAIRFHSLETLATYRWDFIPVAGGTLLVQAGYADVLHANRFVRAFVRKQSAIEHGLALAAQYMLVSALKKEAEKRAHAPAQALATADANELDVLASRGQVVLMRAQPDGHLAEVSAIDRVYAPEAKLRAIIAEPSAYHEFIGGVDRSIVTERTPPELAYSLDMSLPIVTWSTSYRMRVETHSIEGAGIEGNLRGARYRWDLKALKPNETSVVYRANQPLARGSIIIRKLFEVDPSLEYGINVAFALLQLRSMRARAEGWATK